MPVEVVKQMKLLIEGYELSCDSNRVDMTYRADALDKTNFCSSARRRTPGLMDYSVSMAGFHNSSQGLVGTTFGKSGPVSLAALGWSSAVVSVAYGATRGGRAYFGRAAGGEYTYGGSIGDLASFSLALQGNDKLIRGKLMEKGVFTTQDQVNAPGKTTFQDLGTGSTATGRLYAAIHFLRSTERTLNISIRMSSASNFGSQTTMLKWTAQGGTGGKAVWASTKLASTKHRYAKVFLSTGAQAGTIEGAIVAGVVNKITT